MTESGTEVKAGRNTRTQKSRPGLVNRLTKWAFAFQPEEGRLKATLRSILRIVIIISHEFIENNISLRASALTFSIILSMVPMLAMSTAILKGLGSGDQLKTAAYRFIDQLDPQPPPASQPNRADSTTVEGASEVTAEKQSSSLGKHLYNAVDTIFNYVENTNFAALGAFGIAGLLIVVIMVLSSVEDAMNAIWHTEHGRSLFRKIMDYLALLILLPISINVALAGDAILHSPVIMGHISQVIPSTWAVQMLLKLLPFVFIALSLMLMYLFFPHVRVKTSAALCGALFGSISWFIVQRVYVVLQIGVAKYNAIYGSFATVPLFLVWIQLGWTFILLGAVLAYAIQNRNQYQFPGQDSTPQQALQYAFDVLMKVYNDFAIARTTSMEQLLEYCPGASEVDLNRTVNLLIQGGLLHRIEEDDSTGIAPSLPAEKLKATDVVNLVLGHDQSATTPGGTLAGQVIQTAATTIAPEDFPDNYLNKEQERLKAEG